MLPAPGSHDVLGTSVAWAEQFPGALRQPRHDLQTLSDVLLCLHHRLKEALPYYT